MFKKLDIPLNDPRPWYVTPPPEGRRGWTSHSRDSRCAGLLLYRDTLPFRLRQRLRASATVGFAAEKAARFFLARVLRSLDGGANAFGDLRHVNFAQRGDGNCVPSMIDSDCLQ